VLKGARYADKFRGGIISPATEELVSTKGEKGAAFTGQGKRDTSTPDAKGGKR